MVAGQSTDLRGRRILVVEDEYLIAQEIAYALMEAGAETLGPFARLAGAIRLIESGERIDGGLLDVNLTQETIWPVVDLLMARNIPLVLGTGYDASAIPPAYAGLPRCEKPLDGDDLMQALADLLAVVAIR